MTDRPQPMTQPSQHPQTGRSRSIGTMLQILVGVAILADLAFFTALGFQISDHVELTGVALAATCAVVLFAAISRVTRRIGQPG